MRLLTVANLDSHKLGGWERWLQALTARLTHDGHAHLVCLSSEPDALVRDVIEGAGARIIVCDLHGLTLSPTRYLRRLIKQERIDIVHMHFYDSVLSLFSLVAAGLPVRYYVTHHASSPIVEPPPWKSALKRLRYTILGRGLDHVVCVSEIGREQFQHDYQVPREKTSVIYNALDPAEYDRRYAQRQPHDGPLRITSVAHLVQGKGIHVLIEAFGQLHQRRPNCVLQIVGGGAQEHELRRQAGAAGLGARVEFLGFRSDVPALLVDSDIAVVPSIASEAFGYTVIEAAAARLPVVASRIGAIPEIVDSGVEGILFEPGDAAELHAALLRLVDDAPLRRRMGEAGRAKIDRMFSEEAAIDRLVALYTADVHGRAAA